LTSLLASIPSPSEGAIHIGPLQLRAYGLMIALGVVAAVWLSGRRFVQKGIGTQEDVTYIAMWAVPAGVIGSRLYHVITDWNTFEGHWLDVFKIWQGGLGIWGGIAVGVPVGVWAAHRRHIPLDAGLAAITPALPLAQAIGRWGNWWNQELFGRPTTLPWALRISPDKTIAAGYPPGTTFQPTFLYESLWCLALGFALLYVDKRFKLVRGQLFWLYAAGYTAFRLPMEEMRIDPAHTIGPLRVNAWVSIGVFVISVTAFLWLGRRARARGVGADESSVMEERAAP
jgi:prolipoprotein diacylglyceryl transferase